MKWPIKNTMHWLAAIVFVACIGSAHAYAVGPVINAKVYDGKPALLTITSPGSNAIVDVSPVSVEGAIRNISQIMVYVDDAYSSTYPIDNGAVSYKFTATVSSGSHVLKLVAVNPYDGTTVEETVNFTYTPGAQPSTPATAVKSVGQTAEVTQEYFQGQVEQASTTKPATILSDAAYTVMNALDLVPASGQQSMPKMMSRFWAITSGIALIILTNPVITLYHLARYQLMKWNVHALPFLIRHHAAFILRTGGALLLILGFLI